MNIRKFAKLCGVSVSTVSRALGHPPEEAQISRNLYDKIRAKAKELDYRPNYYAQRMQSSHSNNIGFIIGNVFKLVSGELVDAVASEFTPLQKTLSLFACPNGVKDIAPALEKMIHQGMDAIIIHPNTYEDEAEMQVMINSLQKRFSRLPPIVTIFSQLDLPEAFQVRIDEEETGRRAALRQLACGCGKFGILSHVTSNPRSEMIIDSYRETLVANGIAPERIVRVNAEYMASPESLQSLEGIDGMWLSFLLSMPGMRPGLEQVCQLDTLHVDSFTSIESLTMFSWLRPTIGTKESRLHPFKSLFLGVVSLREAGICAAKMALEAGADKNLTAFTRHIACDHVEFNEKLRTLIFA